jgi:hypothetical protein
MTTRAARLALLIFAFSLAATSQKTPAKPASPVDSMEHKIRHLQQNAALPAPDPKPTEFTAQEVNAYIASGRVKLPAGVQSVRFESQPDIIHGSARVDFDQLKSGRSSSNPLLSIFSGIHEVAVIAHARGMKHTGYVEIDSVALDGVEIPRFVLQVFVEKYLQPKYPDIGLNSQFSLPARIDTATVGQNKLTVTQN